MTKIEELRAAYEATTPGEWKHVEGLCDDDAYVARLGDTDFVESDCPEWPDGAAAVVDANFIALAHNNMPALLEAVEALEKMKVSFEDLLNGYPERELHEPYQVTLNRAHSILEELK